MTDVFQRLINEHREIGTLLDQLAEVGEGEQRVRLFTKMRECVMAHAKAEEETLYPVAVNYFARTEAVAGVREHDAILSLVRRIESLGMRSSLFRLTLDELRGTVRRHVEEEETVLIPQLKAGLTEKEAAVLERHYRETYEKVMTSLVHGRRPLEQRPPA